MCGGGTGLGRNRGGIADRGGLLSGMNLPQLGQNGFGMPQNMNAMPQGMGGYGGMQNMNGAPAMYGQPTFPMQQPMGPSMNQFQHSASGPAGGVPGTPGAQNLSPEDYQLYGHHTMTPSPMAPQGAGQLPRPY